MSLFRVRGVPSLLQRETRHRDCEGKRAASNTLLRGLWTECYRIYVGQLDFAIMLKRAESCAKLACKIVISFWNRDGQTASFGFSSIRFLKTKTKILYYLHHQSKKHLLVLSSFSKTVWNEILPPLVLARFNSYGYSQHQYIYYMAPVRHMFLSFFRWETILAAGGD